MASNLKKHLTDEMIERLRPAKATRQEYGDALCKGLLLRVSETGIKSFSVIYRVRGEGGVNENGRLLRGKQRRITLGQHPHIKLEDARKQALQIVTKADKGEDPRQEALKQNLLRNSNSFETVLERFIELHAKPNTVAWKNVERVLNNHAVPEFGRRPVDKITRSDVHNLLDKIIQSGKSGIAKEVKKHLCTMYNWAINREICNHNPALNLARKDLKPNDNAGRSLEDDEIRAVWRATERMGYPFGPVYQLLLLTGQRKNEWGNARINEINVHEGCLEIPRARYKSRRDHIVPFSDIVSEIVAGLPEWTAKDYFLFTTKGGRVPVSGFGQAKSRLDNFVIEELCKIRNDKKVKLKPYRTHDFRVTCETRLANLGFNQEIRDRVLGHAASGLQKTYNKYDYADEKRQALQAYAAHIMEIVNGKN